MLVSSRQWTLSLLWQPQPCHPPLPGARPSTPILSCTSCGGSSITGKRPSPAAIGVMPLDASRYSPSPCSYMSVQPLQGFSLQVSLCFGSTSIHSHPLLDSGASTCFIDKSFVRTHNIPTVRTSQLMSVEASPNIIQGKHNILIGDTQSDGGLV